MPTRDYRLDRAKGILIFTVVLGHLLARTSPWESDALRAPMTLIYAFHMPAFVFLAGITAKSNRLAERVLTFLVLLFTALPLMWGWLWGFGLDPDYDLLTPYWFTWFLLSMAWWMLTVPFIERFPRPTLTVSLIAGLIGGALPLIDYELSAVRSLVFWPFFVIGKLYGREIINWAGNLGLWQKLGLSAAALAVVAAFYLRDVSASWFYGGARFDSLGVDLTDGIGTRLILSAGAMLLTLALLSWMTNRSGIIATIGARSLAVYIGHGFVVRALQPILDDSRDHLGATMILGVCFALAVFTTLLLSWEPFDRALRTYAATVATFLLKPFPVLRDELGQHSAPAGPVRRDTTPARQNAAGDAPSTTSARQDADARR